MATTKSSVCLCKSVEISVTGDDKGGIICHCHNCQLFTGSSYAHNQRFRNAELKVIRGEDLIQQYADTETETGNTIYRHFCSKCVSFPAIVPLPYLQWHHFRRPTLMNDLLITQGSPLYLTQPGNQGFVGLPAGTLSVRPLDRPVTEIYTKAKHSWLDSIVPERTCEGP